MSDYQSEEYTFRNDFPVLAAEVRRQRRLGKDAEVDPAALRMAETWLYGPRDMPLDEDGL